eukprot:TRINITY_DN1496_c0_g1_i3.p3 TRINITY_DN1496_c0_g1~~TRINITY_DN1496_c0_g1_i3.p3  ORF type:complete len:108 (-),score=1.40 TRINITY_DN1496_c0_g1_i3:57-380(-)
MHILRCGMMRKRFHSAHVMSRATSLANSPRIGMNALYRRLHTYFGQADSRYCCWCTSLRESAFDQHNNLCRAPHHTRALFQYVAVAFVALVGFLQLFRSHVACDHPR